MIKLIINSHKSPVFKCDIIALYKIIKSSPHLGLFMMFFISFLKNDLEENLIGLKLRLFTYINGRDRMVMRSLFCKERKKKSAPKPRHRWVNNSVHLHTREIVRDSPRFHYVFIPPGEIAPDRVGGSIHTITLMNRMGPRYSSSFRN